MVVTLEGHHHAVLRASKRERNHCPHSVGHAHACSAVPRLEPRFICLIVIIIITAIVIIIIVFIIIIRSRFGSSRLKLAPTD